MHSIRYLLKTVLKRTFFENTGCFCSIVKRHLLICCINSVDCCWSLFFFFKPLCEKTNFQNKILFSVPKYERFGPLGVRQVKARTARGSLKRSSDRSKTEKTYVRTTLHSNPWIMFIVCKLAATSIGIQHAYVSIVAAGHWNSLGHKPCSQNCLLRFGSFFSARQSCENGVNVKLS